MREALTMQRIGYPVVPVAAVLISCQMPPFATALDERAQEDREVALPAGHPSGIRRTSDAIPR